MIDNKKQGTFARIVVGSVLENVKESSED